MRGIHRYSSLLATVAPLTLLVGQQSAPLEESSAVATLPVIEVWYVVPQPDREREMISLQRQMSSLAEAAFTEMRITFFERMYADDEAYLSFFHYEGLDAERRGRSKRGANSEWAGMFQQMVEWAVDEESYRSILLPVAGRSGPIEPKLCRFYSRSRMHPFRRAIAQERARDLVDHLNATYSELAAYAYVDDLGDPYDLYLFVDHEALMKENPHGAKTSWEATRRALRADGHYARLLERLGEVLEEPISEIVTVQLR